MANFLRYLSPLAFILSAQAFAEDNISKAIEKFFPKTLSELHAHDGSPLSLDNDGLGYIYKMTSFNKSKSANDVVVLYQAWTAISEASCIVSVIQIDNNEPRLAAPTVLNNPYEISNCDDIQLIDFSGSGIPEVVVTTRDAQGRGSLPEIYGWQHNKLVNITPSRVQNGSAVELLRDYKLTTMSVGKSKVIIDTPNEIFDGDKTTRTFAMSNGKFVLQGTFDFFQIIDIKSMKTETAVYNPSFATEGQYTLEVKNLSDHNRAVRAEVAVNGSVVLNPQDFCSAPPRPKKDKKWWFGHDDDDDHDKDSCKRCVPKNEVYAIVNMKTTNEIKVKVYGRRDSKIQLTLVKK